MRLGQQAIGYLKNNKVQKQGVTASRVTSGDTTFIDYM